MSLSTRICSWDPESDSLYFDLDLEMSVLHSGFKDQLPEMHVDTNTPRNPFPWVTDAMIHFVDLHWPMRQRLEMCLVWIQKLWMEKVYTGFQNIVKVTKSLHSFVMLIRQQCLFSKRDMKVDGEGAREDGLTMGVAKEGYRWNDPCVNVKLSAIKN